MSFTLKFSKINDSKNFCMIQCEKYFSCKNPIALQYKNDLIENFKFDLHYVYFIFVHVPGSKQ